MECSTVMAKAPFKFSSLLPSAVWTVCTIAVD